MKRALVLLFVFLVGCQGCTTSLLGKPKRAPAPTEETETIPVWVDSKFSEKERGDVEAALDAWNVALNGYADFFVVSSKLPRPCENPDVQLRITLTGQGLTINRDDVDPEDDTGEVGHWDSDDDSIHVIVDKVGFRDMRRIVMHEVGHFLIRERYPHLPIRGSLMFPIYDFQPSCVDWATAAAVAHVQGWDWHSMNYCDPWGIAGK